MHKKLPSISHALIVLSIAPESNRFSFSIKSNDVIESSCPVIDLKCFKSLLRMTQIVITLWYLNPEASLLLGKLTNELILCLQSSYYVVLKLFV
jgi:hypothetical protein